MKKKSFNTIKLGLFVLSGLVLLIFGLYVLGKGRNLFGTWFEVKTQFRDVNGLLVGNNVRFSGIDVGSVRGIDILNDTMIEVTMNLENKMKNFIRQNALASLGTDGLIGNRVVNITPAGGNAAFVFGGEMLPSREEVRTEVMLQTLSRTNDQVSKIAEELHSTIRLINTSTELNKILNDQTLSANLRASLVHFHETTEKAAFLMKNAVETLKLAAEGDGTLATLLTDTTLSVEIKQAVRQIKMLENSADRLVNDLNQAVLSVEKDINQGNGPANLLMRDSLLADRLRASVEHVELGTAAFSENMEALKSNFLFRRHFKKLEKKAAKKQ